MFNTHAQFDVLVLGATGFTGTLITRYLYAHPARGQFTFGIAARSPQKLKELASSLNLDASVTLLQVDVLDSNSVDAAVRQAKVVINTVGPYWSWGTPVVKSCVQHGVHYVDLNGETYWVLDIINKFHYFATKTNTIIVPSCGFDSIPSDICVYLSNRALKALTPPNQPPLAMAQSVTAVSVGGGISGGTLNTMFTFFETVPTKIAAAANAAWSISPVPGLPFPRPQLTYTLPFYPNIVGSFWFMKPTNSAIIQRTCGLQQAELLRLRAHSSVSAQELSEQERLTVGPQFTYEEFLVCKNKLQAFAVTISIAVFGLAMITAPVRWVLKKLLPAPGTGPSEKVMQNGFLRLRNVSMSVRTPGGTLPASVHTEITVRGDPGYLATSVMISESALSILLSMEELPVLGQRGGVLTPMSALGDVLIKRLEASGRFQFEYGLVDSSGETRKTI